MLTPAVTYMLAALFLAPAVLQWLWNLTCPEILSLPRLTYWQAFRLMIIVAILLGTWHAVLTPGAVKNALFR